MVLRSSCHTLRKGLGRRRRAGDPGPQGNPLDSELIDSVVIFDYDDTDYDLRGEIFRILQSAFEVSAPTLESFVVEVTAESQRKLTESMKYDESFLSVFLAMVENVILPRLPGREFYLQCPPTLRVQPPSDVYVKEHTDADYGHQHGELNFWMPLTDPDMTMTTLWVEDAPVPVRLSQICQFHGTSRRHKVPANSSRHTRVSLDFRIGIQDSFDPKWSLKGTLAEHDRIRLK